MFLGVQIEQAGFPGDLRLALSTRPIWDESAHCSEPRADGGRLNKESPWAGPSDSTTTGRPLAVALMEGQEGVSFESVYGPAAREVSFEYDRFLETLGNGYRSDLTAWPWKAKFQRLGAASEATVTIKAQAGWQPARVLVESGDRLEIKAAGTWRIAAAGRPLDAGGAGDGRGRLVATVFSDYTLTPDSLRRFPWT